jgi:hypothetical protein
MTTGQDVKHKSNCERCHQRPEILALDDIAKKEVHPVRKKYKKEL